MVALSFDIFYRDHGADKGLKNLSKSSKQASKDWSDTKTAMVGGAAIAGAALFKMGKDSINVATNIAESQSKISVVFGKSAQSVLDFSETSASSLGISKDAALEAAGTFGNLFVSLKLPQGEAAKMSTKMITLAADMASFNNASPEEALEAIRSGLVGETEPLRRFGVNMNDATLRTQAMSMGLIKNTKEALSPAVKAQAAYGLMLAQTGTAQGDFGRTSNGLANQQRILAARFKDLQGELGAKLLPVVTDLAGKALNLLTVFEKHQGVILPLAGAVAGLAIAVWSVNKATAAATKTQAAWSTVMQFSTARTEAQTASLIKLRTVASTLGTVMAIVGVAVAAVWSAEKFGQWEVATQSITKLSTAMKSVAGQAKLSTAEIEMFNNKGLLGVGKTSLTSKQALDSFGTSAYNALDKGWNARLGRWQDMGSAQSKFKKQTEQLDAAFAKIVADGNVNDAQNQMRLYEDAATKAGVPLASLRSHFPKYAEAVANSKLPVNELTGATKSHTKAVKQDTEALAANGRALLKQQGGQIAYEAAVDDATATLKENGRGLDVNKEKGRANKTALIAIANATLDWRDSIKAAGGSQKSQDAALERGRAQLVATGKRMGMTRTQAINYANAVLGIPKKYSSQISLALKNSIPKTLFGIKVGAYGNGLGFRLATGGPVYGRGTETSDSIPGLLSHNEHVWTAREVKAAGGHDAVKSMRASALQGWAGGGPVSSALYQTTQSTSARLAKMIESTAMRAIGYSPGLNGALAFARRQVGKPYSWGGVGPGGYDCSGFMSALTNVAQGKFPPYSRRFATGGFPTGGWSSGPGAFSIGWFRGNPGHMAGTINGVNVESAGGVGVRVGSSARGARNGLFTGIAHLNGFARGGAVEMRKGDAPYDLLDPHGQRFAGNAVRRAVLYDGGGMLGHGGVAVNRSGGAERILSRAQTASFDRLVSVLDRRTGSTGDVIVSINATGSDIELENKIVKVLNNAKRHGRLGLI